MLVVEVPFKIIKKTTDLYCFLFQCTEGHFGKASQSDEHTKEVDKEDQGKN